MRNKEYIIYAKKVADGDVLIGEVQPKGRQLSKITADRATGASAEELQKAEADLRERRKQMCLEREYLEKRK